MADVLVCWLGNTDLKAAQGDPAAGLGPIGRAVAARRFDAVHLLSDYPDSRSAPYAAWLRTQTSAPVRVRAEPLSGPTRFGEIYEAAVRGVTEALEAAGPGARLAFHLSPGTPAMAAVWILLAKTRFPAELIESSPQEGVVTASVPFDLSADFLPDLLRRPDRELERLSQGLPPEAPEFADILHRSPEMQRVVARARRVAPRCVPVLIEGASGTGRPRLHQLRRGAAADVLRRQDDYRARHHQNSKREERAAPSAAICSAGALRGPYPNNPLTRREEHRPPCGGGDVVRGTVAARASGANSRNQKGEITMTAKNLPALGSASFEGLKQTNQHGAEYWSARDLQPLLGYSQWRRFEQAIERAATSCKQSGNEPDHHFAGVGKMVELGSGSTREVPDYHLSRFACYLIAQNGDPRKPEIAEAQKYFAIQTRRQELSDEYAADLERLELRKQTAEEFKALSGAASRRAYRAGCSASSTTPATRGSTAASVGTRSRPGSASPRRTTCSTA